MSAQPVPPADLSPAPAPAPRKRSPLRAILLIIVGLFALAFIGIQLIPVKRTNPAVTAQIQWDSPQTEALARRACMDCHSNETVWPWYSSIAPASWLVYYDVMRGRSQLNLSTYDPTAPRRPGARGALAGDLAYQLGQILAGSQSEPGRDFPRNFPNCQCR